MSSGDKGLLHTSCSEHGTHVRLGIIAGQARVEILVRLRWLLYRCALPLRRMLWHAQLLILRSLRRVLWHARLLILRGLRRVVWVCSSLRLCITSWALLLSLGTAIRPGHSFADDPLPWRFFETLRHWSIRGFGCR